MFLTAIYGGYFGAAQGVLLLAFLSLAINDHLQRLNAAKNVLAALVNGVAAVLFIMVSQVNWAAATLIAAGAVVGGQIGAVLGRRIPGPVLRYVVIVVGVLVASLLLVRR